MSPVRCFGSLRTKSRTARRSSANSFCADFRRIRNSGLMSDPSSFSSVCPTARPAPAGPAGSFPASRTARRQVILCGSRRDLEVMALRIGSELLVAARFGQRDGGLLVKHVAQTFVEQQREDELFVVARAGCSGCDRWRRFRRGALLGPRLPRPEIRDTNRRSAGRVPAAVHFWARPVLNSREASIIRTCFFRFLALR